MNYQPWLLGDKFSSLTFLGNHISKVLMKQFEPVGGWCTFPKVLRDLGAQHNTRLHLSLQFPEGTRCRFMVIPSAGPVKDSLIGY